jgi:hypothetical protein
MAQNASALVPQGWKLLKQVDGDLNKDGKSDAVLLISNPVSNEEGHKPRALAVLLKENASYKLQYVADTPIPDEVPGIVVDPATAVKIENGFLILHYSGEAKEAEANLDVTSKFTYQNNDLFLILVSQKGKEGTKSYSSEYDLLASKITVDKKDSADSASDGKTTLDRPKMPSLPSLKEFDPGMFSMLLHMISVR